MSITPIEESGEAQTFTQNFGLRKKSFTPKHKPDIMIEGLFKDVETPESSNTPIHLSKNVGSPRQQNSNTFKGQRKSLADRSLGMQEMVKCP